MSRAHMGSINSRSGRAPLLLANVMYAIPVAFVAMSFAVAAYDLAGDVRSAVTELTASAARPPVEMPPRPARVHRL
jgi:hypothetical protein